MKRKDVRGRYLILRIEKLKEGLGGNLDRGFEV